MWNVLSLFEIKKKWTSFWPLKIQQCYFVRQCPQHCKFGVDGLEFMPSMFYDVLSVEHTNGAGCEERARWIETGVLHMTFTLCSTALCIHPPICKAIPERLSNKKWCQLILCPYVQHLLVTHIHCSRDLLVLGCLSAWTLYRLPVSPLML